MDSIDAGCEDRFMQESRNNIENTLKGKMKDSQEDVGILEKKAKVRRRLSSLTTRSTHARGRCLRSHSTLRTK